ncbi:hypothetical protein DESA109040_18505 [Deinococcus saxicola]
MSIQVKSMGNFDFIAFFFYGSQTSSRLNERFHILIL